MKNFPDESECETCINYYDNSADPTKCIVASCDVMLDSDICSTCKSGYHLGGSNKQCIVNNC